MAEPVGPPHRGRVHAASAASGIDLREASRVGESQQPIRFVTAGAA
jgi:hypothetical protein